MCTRVQECHNQTDRFYIDIADVSLQQMKKRYQTMRNVQFRAEFIALDCYSVSIFFRHRWPVYRSNPALLLTRNFLHRDYHPPISALTSCQCNFVCIILLNRNEKLAPCCRMCLPIWQEVVGSLAQYRTPTGL